MSRREKVLLQILLSVGIVGVLVCYLLLPAIKKNTALKTENEELVLLQEDMELLLTMSDVAGGLEKAVQGTADTLDFFKKDFATYSVDTVINKLVDENNLIINGLSIQEYTERKESEIGVIWESEDNESEDSEASEEYEEEEEPLLIGADVAISVDGYYEDVLNFIDALNASSKCIRINRFSYSKVENYNPYETYEEEEINKDKEINYVIANISLTIYSIKPFEKSLNGGEVDG